MKNLPGHDLLHREQVVKECLLNVVEIVGPAKIEACANTSVIRNTVAQCTRNMAEKLKRKIV